MPKIQYKEINFRGKSLELINLVNQVINEYKNQGYELTLRQTYYQLVARGYIPNNERSYKNIGNLINDGKFLEKVTQTHGDSKYALVYRAAVEVGRQTPL